MDTGAWQRDVQEEEEDLAAQMSGALLQRPTTTTKKTGTYPFSAHMWNSKRAVAPASKSYTAMAWVVTPVASKARVPMSLPYRFPIASRTARSCADSPSKYTATPPSMPSPIPPANTQGEKKEGTKGGTGACDRMQGPMVHPHTQTHLSPLGGHSDTLTLTPYTPSSDTSPQPQRHAQRDGIMCSTHPSDDDPGHGLEMQRRTECSGTLPCGGSGVGSLRGPGPGGPASCQTPPSC